MPVLEENLRHKASGAWHSSRSQRPEAGQGTVLGRNRVIERRRRARAPRRARSESAARLVKAGARSPSKKAPGFQPGFPTAFYTAAGAVVSSTRPGSSRANIVLAVQPPPKSPSRLSRRRRSSSAWFPWQHFRMIVLPDLPRDGHGAGARACARITRAQSMDVLSSQATVAVTKPSCLARVEMPRLIPMITTAAGSLTPAKALVIGAGVAGLQAIATARRLGAVVSAFDVRPAVKEQVQSLGAALSRSR